MPSDDFMKRIAEVAQDKTSELAIETARQIRDELISELQNLTFEFQKSVATSDVIQPTGELHIKGPKDLIGLIRQRISTKFAN